MHTIDEIWSAFLQEAANEERRQQLASVARVVEVMQEPTSETECCARIEAEREACARVADEAEAGFVRQEKQGATAWDRQMAATMANAVFHIAKSIRARGGK